jgi:hypothetical protein
MTLLFRVQGQTLVRDTDLCALPEGLTLLTSATLLAISSVPSLACAAIQQEARRARYAPRWGP